MKIVKVFDTHVLIDPKDYYQSNYIQTKTGMTLLIGIGFTLSYTINLISLSHLLTGNWAGIILPMFSSIYYFQLLISNDAYNKLADSLTFMKDYINALSIDCSIPKNYPLNETVECYLISNLNDLLKGENEYLYPTCPAVFEYEQ